MFGAQCSGAMDISDNRFQLRGERQHQHPPTQHHNSVAQDVFAGFTAGMASVTLGFPLDMIKSRMQTSYLTSQVEGKSIYKTGRNIVRNEGIGGLYKGLSSPLLSLSLSSSISFTAYSTFREMIHAEKGWHAGNWLAGLGVGPITGILSTVENHVRTQMQIDNVRDGRFRNSFHCIKHILKRYGISTVFTGWCVTTLKDCTYWSSYFFVYEGIKGTLIAPEDLGGYTFSSKAAILLAGGTAGTVAWLIAFPSDCVRAGVQSQSLDRKVTPTGLQVFKNLLQSRGISGLYMGISPSLVRGFLVHSARFSVFESVLWLFRALDTNDKAR